MANEEQQKARDSVCILISTTMLTSGAYHKRQYCPYAFTAVELIKHSVIFGIKQLPQGDLLKFVIG